MSRSLPIVITSPNGLHNVPTGYIGGSVVSRLLEHPKASSFQITALVRSPEKAAKLETIGIKAVVGSFSELDKLEKLSSDADVLISTVGGFPISTPRIET